MMWLEENRLMQSASCPVMTIPPRSSGAVTCHHVTSRHETHMVVKTLHHQGEKTTDTIGLYGRRGTVACVTVFLCWRSSHVKYGVPWRNM